MPRPQFSLKMILWVMTVAALGLACARCVFSMQATTSLSKIQLDASPVLASWIAVLGVFWFVRQRLCNH